MWHTHLDSSDKLHRSQYDAVLLRVLQIGVPLRVRYSCFDRSIVHVVAAMYPELKSPQWYFNCSSLRGTVLYETYVAAQESGGVYHWWLCLKCKYIL